MLVCELQSQVIQGTSTPAMFSAGSLALGFAGRRVSCHVVRTLKQPKGEAMGLSHLRSTLFGLSQAFRWFQLPGLGSSRWGPRCVEQGWAVPAVPSLNSQPNWNHGIRNNYWCFKTPPTIEVEVSLAKLWSCVHRNGEWSTALEKICMSIGYGANQKTFYVPWKAFTSMHLLTRTLFFIFP